MLDNQASLNTPEWTELLSPQPDHELSKVRQLYLALYEAIASQMLPRGQKIPSSRELAKQLNIGRNTVIAVYSQLNDEGLISSNGRKGTRITYSAAAQSINARQPSAQLKPSSIPALSRRSTRTSSSGATGLMLAPGMPDPALFPQADWRKALHKASRLSPDSLGYNAKPLAQLQAAIARYLAVYRSLRVDDEQIIITSSTRQSLMLADIKNRTERPLTRRTDAGIAASARVERIAGECTGAGTRQYQNAGYRQLSQIARQQPEQVKYSISIRAQA